MGRIPKILSKRLCDGECLRCSVRRKRWIHTLCVVSLDPGVGCRRPLPVSSHPHGEECLQVYLRGSAVRSTKLGAPPGPPEPQLPDTVKVSPAKCPTVILLVAVQHHGLSRPQCKRRSQTCSKVGPYIKVRIQCRDPGISSLEHLRKRAALFKVSVLCLRGKPFGVEHDVPVVFAIM